MSIVSPLSQLSVLRKKLDLMGYHEPLPLEAVPLVALLFRDFLQLTESFNNVKTEHSQLLKIKANFEDNVEPFKEENAKLIKENNELYQEILKMRENFETALWDMKAKAKKMEDENTNLKFLNNQYLQKTRSLKNLAQEKSEEAGLQQQNAEVVMQVQVGQKNQPICHVQCMELINILQPASDKSFCLRMKDQASESRATDLLNLSVGTIVKLQNENVELLEVAEQTHKVVKSLEEKVRLRDKEIERLTAQLNPGKSLQTICLETKEKKKDCVIQNLQQQLETLYHQNEELEKIIIKYCGKEYLPEKVRPSAMYNFLVTLGSTEKEALSRKLEKSFELDKPIQHEDNVSSAKYIQRVNRLEKALKLANLEKRKLAEKIPPMLTKEKQLQSEISRLKRKVPPHGASPSQCSERLARLVQILEAQRDFFKEECETLKRLQGKNFKISCRLGEKSSSDTKISEITTKDHEASHIITKRSFVNLVEEERDLYKEKYCKLLERHGNLKELSKATAEKEIMVVDDTLQNLRKENFQLLQRIRELEHQNSQTISKRELAESEKQRTERKNLEKAVSQLQKTVEEFQKELEKTSKEKQIFMKKYQQAIENCKLKEGTSTKVDPVSSELIPNMYTEADVQDKIKEIEQQHKCKDAILQQQIEQVQKVVDELERENEAVKDSLASHKAMVLSLEQQVSVLNYQLSQVADESDQHRTAAEQIRLVIGHGEQSAEELQLSLTQKENELNIAEKRIRTLESDVEQLNDILKHRGAEITDLKSLAGSLEEDKKEAIKALNEKDIRLSSLQQQIYLKELHTSELKITSSALEADVEKVQGEIRLKGEEIRSLKEELQSKTKQVEEISRSLDVLRQENSRVLEALSLLTKENQFITETLEKKLQELEEVRKKDTGYVAELSRIQEVLSLKEQQRSELIQQYKELSHENARLEAETRRLQSEADAAQMETRAKDAELRNLQSTVQSLEHEIEEHLSVQEAHRLEVTFLNSSVSELEAELHQKQQEIERLQMDLKEARSLSVQIDASKEHLQKMLADGDATNAKLTSEIEDLRDEIKALRAQLSSERTSMVTMESLMATHREKEFQSHLMNQELNTEISLLRTRLKENTEKVEILTKELSSLKTKIAEVEMEKERLKREITDERYERERDHNELLRLQHLRQLCVREPISKSCAPFHSKFTSPRLESPPLQKTVPVSSTSEAKALRKTQPEVSSVAEAETLQPALVQAPISELGTHEERRQAWSKETTKQVSSSKTHSSHNIDSLEQHKRESVDMKISSQSSSEESSNNCSHN